MSPSAQRGKRRNRSQEEEEEENMAETEVVLIESGVLPGLL